MCSICCEFMGEDEVECPYCHFGCCSECIGKYLLGGFKEPSCMSCSKAWSREFVMENMEKKWVLHEFLPHIGKVVREQEKLLLPDAQEEASLLNKIKSLQVEIQSLPTNERLMKKFKSKPDELEIKLKEKREIKNKLSQEVSELKAKSILHGYEPDVGKKEKADVKTYVFRCPHDKCRGFVSLDFVCGTCEGRVCEKCHVALSDDIDRHMCKKEDIKSAEVVMSETKPCPKCMTLIFKSSGCNQMFCTQCHTTFDWVTGKVENGVIHNPHFYEYVSKIKNLDVNMEAVACGEIPNPYQFVIIVRNIGVNVEEEQILFKIYRLVQHVSAVLAPKYRVDKIKDNFDLRVGFLRGEFDEDTWAIKLMNRDKKRMKAKAFQDLIQMCVVLLEDLLRKFMYKTLSANNVSKEFKSLCNYYGEALEKIQIVHGGSIPDDLWLN